MKDNRLKQFNLAGGTALALYLGHRKSIDLDLFSPESFQVADLEEYLIRHYNFTVDMSSRNTLKGSIDGVKIDLITHHYPSINSPITTEEGIRLYSVEDIAAMKLSAIVDNGTRLKDFVDIACLSTVRSWSNMLRAYHAKFVNSNPVRPIKAILYFEDINFKEPILFLNGTYQWELIEERLRLMLSNENKTYTSLPLLPPSSFLTHPFTR
jgi:predicted nucleotidyltransferase component of viral defense system